MKVVPIDAQLYNYMLSHSTPEAEVLRALREETAAHTQANMQIPADQGMFMGLLTRIGNVRRYLEVGTFTGYSALAVALNMPSEGRIVACDISEEFTAVARRYWRLAGVDERIELRLAPASASLQQLLHEGAANSFDLAFIDADKVGYPNYYQSVVDLVRPGGMILLDNVLWRGDINNPGLTDADTLAMRQVNSLIAGDRRVQCSMLPIGDGVTLAVKNLVPRCA